MPSVPGEHYVTPIKIKDSRGVVHDYWSNCDQWRTAAGAEDEETVTCMACLTIRVDLSSPTAD